MRDRERDSALAAAREFTGGYHHGQNMGPPGAYGAHQDRRSTSRPRSSSRPNSRPNSRPGSREGSRTRDQNFDPRATSRDFGRQDNTMQGGGGGHRNLPQSASVPCKPVTTAAPAAQAPPSSSKLTAEQVERKTKDLIDEYLHAADTKEAMLCVRELNSPALMHVVVSTSFNHVMERSENARSQTGAFMHDLIKAKIVLPEDFKSGVLSLMEIVEDLEIDIPQIWTYLGQMCGPLVDVGGNFPLKLFKDVCVPLVPINRSGKFMAAVLNHAKTRIGPQNVSECWKKSGLDWSDFFADGSDKEVKQFVMQNGLEFTISAQTPPPSTAPAISIEKAKQQLEDMMKKAEYAEIDGWIQGNVGPRSKETDFIRALMTAVVSSAISGESTNTRYNADVIKKHVKLLHKYLDRSVLMEVQALYALQALVHTLQHPPGLLQHIFDTLYDEDIISEEAFNTWHSSEDQKENEGKGVALKSVVQFFTWLREAEEDDSGASESELTNQS